VAGLVAIAGQRGIGVASLRGVLGGFYESLSAPNARIPIATMRKLLAEIAFRDSVAPLTAAANVTCSGAGLPGFLFLTAPAAASWVVQGRRNVALMSEWGSPSWHSRSDGVHLAFDAGDGSLPDRIMIELCTLSCLAMVRDAFPRCEVRSVHFRHRAPAVASHCVRLAGCSIEYGASENAIRLSDEFLGFSGRLSDQALFSYLDAQADSAYARLESEAPLRFSEPALLMTLRNKIAGALNSEVCSMSEVAEDLGLSERTLRRRLDELGIRYRDLVEEVRVREATRLLEGSASTVSEVAREVGYAEASSLSRAFRRAHRDSPVTLASRARKLRP
jgi:AraC-like DNA-binding protein